MDDLEKMICVHEAGHAIVALYFERIVEYMAIKPNSTPPARTKRGLCEDDGNNCVIAVAGIVAESIYHQPMLLNGYQRYLINDYSGGGCADMKMVREVYTNTTITEDLAYYCAWNILHTRKDKILKLADELYKKRYLTTIDVEEIVLKKRFSLWTLFFNALDRRKRKKQLLMSW